MRRFLIFLLMICVPVASFAADPFKEIVKAIETEYGVRHHGIPWFARAIIKPALLGSGVSGLKLAEFENVTLAAEGSQSRLAEVIEQTVGPEWQQIVRVRSLRDHETTYVYVRPLESKFSMLVVNIESNEAQVVQMNLSPSKLERWMADKDEIATVHHSHQRSGDPVANNRTEEVLISSTTPGGYGMLVP